MTEQVPCASADPADAHRGQPVVAGRAAGHSPGVLRIRPVRGVAAGGCWPGPAARVLSDLVAGSGNGRRRLHDAGLARGPGRSRLAPARHGGRQDQFRVPAGQIHSRRGLGLRCSGRAWPGRPAFPDGGASPPSPCHWPSRSGRASAVAAAATPIASPGLVQRYWWALAAVPVIVVGLCPPVFGRMMDGLLSLARRQPLERRLSWPNLARAVAWTLLGWALLGLQVWLLLADMAAGGPRLYLLATGGYALAFSVSTLLIVFPSGIGAREVGAGSSPRYSAVAGQRRRRRARRPRRHDRLRSGLGRNRTGSRPGLSRPAATGRRRAAHTARHALPGPRKNVRPRL